MWCRIWETHPVFFVCACHLHGDYNVERLPCPRLAPPPENCGMCCLDMTLPWVHDSQPQPGCAHCLRMVQTTLGTLAPVGGKACQLVDKTMLLFYIFMIIGFALGCFYLFVCLFMFMGQRSFFVFPLCFVLYLLYVFVSVICYELLLFFIYVYICIYNLYTIFFL